MLPAMYHGTARKAWARDESGLALHLTRDIEAALDYARQSRDNWLMDYPDSAELEPIIIEFGARTLSDMVSSGEVRLMPTLGDEEIKRITDWREGFASSGAVRLEGFDNAMKARGVIKKV